MIEEFMKKHPEKVTRVPPQLAESEPPELDGLVQLGETVGAYRRKKQKGSDEQ